MRGWLQPPFSMTTRSDSKQITSWKVATDFEESWRNVQDIQNEATIGPTPEFLLQEGIYSDLLLKRT